MTNRISAASDVNKPTVKLTEHDALTAAAIVTMQKPRTLMMINNNDCIAGRFFNDALQVIFGKRVGNPEDLSRAIGVVSCRVASDLIDMSVTAGFLPREIVVASLFFPNKVDETPELKALTFDHLVRVGLLRSRMMCEAEGKVFVLGVGVKVDLNAAFTLVATQRPDEIFVHHLKLAKDPSLRN